MRLRTRRGSSSGSRSTTAAARSSWKRLGRWWLFGLLAAAALIALHELYGVTRPLRPLVAAGYAGGILALAGATAGGLEWMLAGFLATFVLAFVLNAVAETRAPATVAIG